MTDTYKSQSNQDMVLIEAGRVTETLDFAMTAGGFTSFKTIDVSSIEPIRLQVSIFGQVNDDFSGIPNPQQNYVAQPGLNAFYFNTGRADCYYQIYGGNLYLGIV